VVATVGKRVGTRRAGTGKRLGKRSRSSASGAATTPRGPVAGYPRRGVDGCGLACGRPGGSAHRPTSDGRYSVHAPHDARRGCPNSCPLARPLRSRPGTSARVQRPAVRQPAARVDNLRTTPRTTHRATARVPRPGRAARAAPAVAHDARRGTRRAGAGKRLGKRSPALASFSASGRARRRPVRPRPHEDWPAVAGYPRRGVDGCGRTCGRPGGSAHRATHDGRYSVHAPHDARRGCPNSCPLACPRCSRPGTSARVQRPAVRQSAARVRQPAGNSAGNSSDISSRTCSPVRHLRSPTTRGAASSSTQPPTRRPPGHRSGRPLTSTRLGAATASRCRHARQRGRRVLPGGVRRTDVAGVRTSPCCPRRLFHPRAHRPRLAHAPRPMSHVPCPDHPADPHVMNPAAPPLLTRRPTRRPRYSASRRPSTPSLSTPWYQRSAPIHPWWPPQA